jgi:hypothetical protein
MRKGPEAKDLGLEELLALSRELLSYKMEHPNNVRRRLAADDCWTIEASAPSSAPFAANNKQGRVSDSRRAAEEDECA